MLYNTISLPIQRHDACAISCRTSYLEFNLKMWLLENNCMLGRMPRKWHILYSLQHHIHTPSNVACKCGFVVEKRWLWKVSWRESEEMMRFLEAMLKTRQHNNRFEFITFISNNADCYKNTVSVPVFLLCLKLIIHCSVCGLSFKVWLIKLEWNKHTFHIHILQFIVAVSVNFVTARTEYWV